MRVSNCTVSVCLAGEFLVFCIGGSMLMGGGCTWTFGFTVQYISWKSVHA